MLEISTKEFLSDPVKYLLGAAVNDDFIKVQNRAENTVIVSEAEWNIMLDAFKMLLNAEKVLPLDSMLSENRPAISDYEMSDLMMEKNKAKRNEAIDKMTEEDAKRFLKKLLSVMNRHTEK